MNSKLKIHPGDTFQKVAHKAKQFASDSNTTVEFDFNGVTCIVSATTNLDNLYRYYLDSWLMEWKTIGPDCLDEYDADTQSLYNARKAEQDEKKRLVNIESERADNEARAAVSAKIEGVSMQFANLDAWQKGKEVNTDPYGAGIYEYAETWARLMQVEMSSGTPLADCASPTSFEMGYLGISGFMYGAAVSVLAQCWIHGEELRVWHNGKYGQSGDGVVNPAILTITN